MHQSARWSEATVPPPVPPGGQIRIITPSARGADISTARFDRGIGWLRDRGYEVVPGAQLLAAGDHAAGDGQARAREVNDAYSDPAVSAIVACIGGHNTNAVLRHLDFDLIARNPKPLIGYSDVTALLVPIYCQTGQVTYHGPTLMPELAEWPEPYPYTAQWFDMAMRANSGAWRYECPAAWTEEFLPWGLQDVRERVTRTQSSWRWLRPGHGQGVLFGGNLETLCALAGTGHLEPPPSTVLFWETTDTHLATIDRSLTQLEDCGVLDGISAMVVGKSFRGTAGFEDSLTRFLQNRYEEVDWPIVASVDLGHPDPMITIPIGREAVVSSESRRFDVLPVKDQEPPRGDYRTADSREQGPPYNGR